MIIAPRKMIIGEEFDLKIPRKGPTESLLLRDESFQITIMVLYPGEYSELDVDVGDVVFVPVGAPFKVRILGQDYLSVAMDHVLAIYRQE